MPKIPHSCCGLSSNMDLFPLSIPSPPSRGAIIIALVDERRSGVLASCYRRALLRYCWLTQMGGLEGKALQEELVFAPGSGGKAARTRCKKETSWVACGSRNPQLASLPLE